MKKQLSLLFAITITAIAAETKAQIPSTYYSAPDTENEFYLYNIGLQKFLNGAFSWSYAVYSDTPVTFRLGCTASSTGKVQMTGKNLNGTTHGDGNNYLGMDNNNFQINRPSSSSWDFQFFERDAESHIYSFGFPYNNAQYYFGSVTGNYGPTENDKYQTLNGVISTEATTDEYKWALIKPSDYNAYVIANNNGNATSLVVNADCSSVTGWSAGSLKTGQKYISGTTSAIQLDASGDVSQTVKNLPAGTYTVQMLIRGEPSNKSDGLKLNSDEKTVVTYVDGNGAKGNVNADGLVSSSYLESSNDGWVLLEGSTTLPTAGDLTITVSLASAGRWAQFTSVKLLKDINTNPVTSTYVDMTGADYFLHFGETKNQVIKASSNTANTSNVIANSTCASLVLTDGAYNFGVDEGFTATALSYDRSFTADQLSTVCLPFALTADEVSAAGTFYELASYSDGSLHFNEVNTTEAYKPYLFKAASSGTPFSSLSSKAISASTSEELTSTATGASMVGTLIAQTLRSDESNTLYGYKSDGTFVQIGSNNGAHINPFRAYIMIPGASNVKSLKASLDISTSIEPTPHLTTDSSQIEAAAVYNLSGKRVQNPVRGIYIRGNKKFMVK